MYVDVILSRAGLLVLLSFVWWIVAERYRSLSHGAVDQGLSYVFFSNFLIVREVLEIALMVVD